MKFPKNKRILVIPILLLIMTTAIITILYSPKTKSSTIVGIYSESSTDGCDGFELKNGEKVDTFCFWTRPENQTNYEGPINIGDQVEYGTESGKQFIRLKQ